MHNAGSPATREDDIKPPKIKHLGIPEVYRHWGNLPVGIYWQGGIYYSGRAVRADWGGFAETAAQLLTPAGQSLQNTCCSEPVESVNCKR